jgi:hypothetical protein
MNIVLNYELSEHEEVISMKKIFFVVALILVFLSVVRFTIQPNFTIHTSTAIAEDSTEDSKEPPTKGGH